MVNMDCVRELKLTLYSLIIATTGGIFNWKCLVVHSIARLCEMPYSRCLLGICVVFLNTRPPEGLYIVGNYFRI